ncbi:MAG TPA: serine hydrolase domain-containing protein [Kofleriaceae bacterium]
MVRWVAIAIAIVTLSARSAPADKLDAELAKTLKADNIPGLSFAVIKDGRVVRLGAYGLANVEHRVKVTTATRFEIASMSKMFIATAIRILADDHKLDLDDLLSKYFDKLPPAWKDMRIRHLVAMSAGLPEDWELMCYCDVRDEYDDKTMLDAFAKLKLLSPLGERFHYSSPSYAMLGMIVTKVTGKPFADFVTERIFKPAGMTESTYNDPAAVIASRADGYRLDDTTKALKRGYYVAPYMHARADVGILTTPRDYAKFVIALDAGKIVKDPERLLAPFSSDDGKRDLRYAYGWTVGLVDGHRGAMHTGGFRTGFSTVILRLPDEHLTLITMTNRAGAGMSTLFGVLRHYVRGADDKQSTKDPDPAATARLIKALQAAAAGTVDPALFAADALSGIEDKLPAIAKATITFGARHALDGSRIRWHGQPLADFVTLRIKIPNFDSEVGLDVYRDDKGVVRDIEPAP